MADNTSQSGNPATNWLAQYNASQSAVGGNLNQNNPDSALASSMLSSIKQAASTPTEPVSNVYSTLPTSVQTYGANYYGIDQQPQQFQYDPSTDASLQQYLGQANKSAYEELNARGMLNSSLTPERIAQILATATPQYEQNAYSRWSDDYNRQLQRAQFLSGADQQAFQNQQTTQAQAQSYTNQVMDYVGALDDESYAQYKQSLAANQATRAQEISTLSTQVTSQKSALTSAINRVNSTGTVDNEAALLLGVPVGTPAAQAANAIIVAKQNLQNMELQLSYLQSSYAQQTKAEQDAMAWRDAYYNPRVMQTASYSSVSNPNQYLGTTTTKTPDNNVDALINQVTSQQTGYLQGAYAGSPQSTAASATKKTTAAAVKGISNRSAK